MPLRAATCASHVLLTCRSLTADRFEVAHFPANAALRVQELAILLRVVGLPTARASLLRHACRSFALLCGLRRTGVLLARRLEVTSLTADSALLVEEPAVFLDMPSLAATLAHFLCGVIPGACVRLSTHGLGMPLLAAIKACFVLKFAFSLLVARLAATLTPRLFRPCLLRLAAHGLQMPDLATDAARLVGELALLLRVAALATAITPNFGRASHPLRRWSASARCPSFGTRRPRRGHLRPSLLSGSRWDQPWTKNA
mmetsp:Transcript_26862/g.77731  ORF Transcript_26862/g.77731 Transcript_26862/m.77731 type:complete len:257 (+) Transcript_26862:672-1442(+)